MNACCVYDFTIWNYKDKKIEDDDSVLLIKEKIVEFLSSICKKWCFQLECGEETGGYHFQGRLSLKVKERENGIVARFNHEFINGWGRLSITSKENFGNMFYVMKEDTRVKGPWSDEKDAPLYIPRQVREIEDKLFPWQKYIINSYDVWDNRCINIINNCPGGIGKSCLKSYIVCKRLGLAVPPLTNYQDMCQFICSFPAQRLYVFDLPRGFQKNKNMLGFWNGIEEIKNGYVFDTRYHGKIMTFDCPNIWIFTNEDTDLSHLTKDKWICWSVRDGYLYNSMNLKV